MKEGRGETGTNRVLRGGSWANDAENCRSAYRNWNHPANRNDNIGFRPVSSKQVSPDSGGLWIAALCIRL
jgi:formylglycine-generating enzyme required for sulfatase activity